MSSSYRLRKRLQEPSYYGLGHWADHYVKAGQGECSPNYDTIMIGDKPGGVKVCVKKKFDNGDEITHPKKVERDNRNYRNSYNLYEGGKEPRQVSNAYSLSDRTFPVGYAYSVENDLRRIPKKYDSTGVRGFNW